MNRIFFIIVYFVASVSFAFPIQMTPQALIRTEVGGEVTKMKCTLLGPSSITIRHPPEGSSYAETQEKDMLETTVQVPRSTCSRLMSSNVRMWCSEKLMGKFQIDTHVYLGQTEQFGVLVDFVLNENKGSVVCP